MTSLPIEAFKHKKSGYKLFKAGYPRQIMVKPNVKKEMKQFIYFLVRCHVNAEIKKKQYLVYVHLDQHTGDIAYMQNAIALLALVAVENMCRPLCISFSIILKLDCQIYQMIKPAPFNYKSGMSLERPQHKQPYFSRTSFPPSIRMIRTKKGVNTQYQKGRGRTTVQQERRCHRMTWNGLKLAWKKQEALVIWLIS
jgi:hypothetical protein